MKKTSFLLTCLLSLSLAFSQTDESKTVLSLNAGFSVYRAYVWAAIQANDKDTVTKITTKTNPVAIFGIDHSFNKRFSLGASFAFQSVSADYDRFYGDSLQLFEQVTASVSKLSVTLRPLFYYGKSEKNEFYSGLRVGFQKVFATENSVDRTYTNIDDLVWNRITIGIIPFGMRHYFTDQIGANFEFSVGVPNFFSFGLNYKFSNAAKK